MAVTGEASYLQLVRKILAEGERRDTRNAVTLSLFGERLEFDLRQGFPLLTTKKIFTRAVIEELLWFLRGETDAKTLQQRGVHIWDGNSTREFLDSRGLDYPEGECGPIYGFQWRAFNGEYPSRRNGVDQIAYILKELTDNPHSRRILFSGWNPCQMNDMCLPPCHILYQFYLSPTHGLSCQMYARSQDIMLGTPFNIASTALLTHLIAALLHVPAHRIILVAGDTHIYEAHMEGANTQVERAILPPPSFNLLREPPPRESSVEEKIAFLESLTLADFEFKNYQSHPTIKMPMIA